MLAVCLDKPHPQVPLYPSPFRDSHMEILAKRALHGDGTAVNSCNRWFDTAVQVGGYTALLLQLLYSQCSKHAILD